MAGQRGSDAKAVCEYGKRWGTGTIGAQQCAAKVGKYESGWAATTATLFTVS